MTVRPNRLPRTLIGVGGARFYNLPGVIYPDEVLQNPPGSRGKKNRIYDKIPSWGITTAEAAKMMGCTPSSARAVLHHHKVTHHRVSLAHEPARLFWRKSAVEKLIERRNPIVRCIPKRMIDADLATRMLGVARSTLYRLVKSGYLREKAVRIMTVHGPRHKSLFVRADVAKLAARRRAEIIRRCEMTKMLMLSHMYEQLES